MAILDINEIRGILPHRYPFLLVDRIVEMEADRIVGIKNITVNEPQFTGHFPDFPVMPGVLIVEAMAQAGAVMAMKSATFDPATKVIYFMALDKVKFATNWLGMQAVDRGATDRYTGTSQSSKIRRLIDRR